MHSKNHDLHGSAPDHARTALILIDVINELAFDEGPSLLEHALPAARRIHALKTQAMKLQLPVIYANDNFGKWRSDFRAAVDSCRKPGVLGKPIAELLAPSEEDYFILKPKHSAFFSTTLETLLRYLGATTLVLTGFASNICVLFTANDAYMRDYKLVIPEDCVAANSKSLNDFALEQMRTVLKADTRPSTELDLGAL
jgi:nicotinamidase-related amidase